MFAADGLIAKAPSMNAGWDFHAALPIIIVSARLLYNDRLRVAYTFTDVKLLAARIPKSWMSSSSGLATSVDGEMAPRMVTEPSPR